MNELYGIISKLDGLAFHYLNAIRTDGYHIWHCVRIVGFKMTYECYHCGTCNTFDMNDDLLQYYNRSYRIEDRDTHEYMMECIKKIFKQYIKYMKYHNYGNTKVFDTDLDDIEYPASEFESVYQTGFEDGFNKGFDRGLDAKPFVLNKSVNSKE